MRRSREYGLALTCLLGSNEGMVRVQTLALGLSLSHTSRLLDRSREGFFLLGRWRGMKTMEDRGGGGLAGKSLGVGSKAEEHRLMKEFARIGKDLRAVSVRFSATLCLPTELIIFRASTLSISVRFPLSFVLEIRSDISSSSFQPLIPVRNSTSASNLVLFTSPLKSANRLTIIPSCPPLILSANTCSPALAPSLPKPPTALPPLPLPPSSTPPAAKSAPCSSATSALTSSHATTVSYQCATNIVGWRANARGIGWEVAAVCSAKRHKLEWLQGRTGKGT